MELATKNELVERRKSKRFLVQETAFICFNSNPAMAARIVDVGDGGLGFTYLASKQRTGHWFNLDIFCVVSDSSWLGIPVRTISDFETGVRGERRSGVQFGRLTQNQRHDVRKILDRCTLGEA